ncbi:hypothetical protein Stsp02_18500 [Streptomyces sp. NBRC 14336]|uniref:DUF3574 domain-containing protein n=1 Tax=Streptomyces sp. NBRC 14336 TaxID=3030992 RepID=UPI0024A3A736|nr:DUF3574 domain-containing protein [Streptomyces sp. NBRC 14336]WBO77017.1 DUF3574 domain-containing protein [Streptomyces sp. SBE_14.2]GLW46188.1 hypothetical protein Stsp02_18500 [Streptomyces sp. NBRC 14336]
MNVPIKQRPRTRAALLAAGLLLAVAAPTAYATLDDSESGGLPRRGAPYVETLLFFGTERPDGGPAVTDEQFMAFVDEEVTPGFPDGLTVRTSRGQWRNADGTIDKERSYELVLLYPVAAAQTGDRKIEEIRRAYEKEFGQEAVGRVDDRVEVDF